MKKLLLLFFLSFFVFDFCEGQTIISSGPVYGTWTVAGSPYLIQGDLTIPNDSTLNIDPGVTVNFQGTYQIRVWGRLLAVGTSTDSIYFTATDTVNGWRSIRFDSTASMNDSSIISFCDIEWSKSCALFFNLFSKALISNCVIKNNYSNYWGGGVACLHGSCPIISNNIFTNNKAYASGGAIYLDYNSDPIILNNIISYNIAQTQDGGGIDVVGGSKPLISGNIISYNNAVNAWGGGILLHHAGATLLKNTISNNIAYYGGGIYIDGGGSALYNNTVTNNGAVQGGGAIAFAFVNTNTSFFNNTIANNGGGELWFQSSTLTILNCIIYNIPYRFIFLYDEGADPNFYYCDITGGQNSFYLNGNTYTGTYQNNMDTVPQFVNPSSSYGQNYDGVNADWSLLSTSPCINAGDTSGSYPSTDKAGNPRIVGGRIDMGAFEFQSDLGLEHLNMTNQISIYPNPFTQSLTIQSHSAGKKEILLFDVTGKEILRQQSRGLGTEEEIKLNTGNIVAGFYLLRVEGENFKVMKEE